MEPLRKQIAHSWGKTVGKLMKGQFREELAEFKPTRSDETARDKKNAFPP